MSTKIEKLIKKRFYSIIQKLVQHNTTRWNVPFSKLTIAFFENSSSDIEGIFNYPLGIIYINTYRFDIDTIDYLLIHEISHFLIYCSFDNSNDIFHLNRNFHHSTHSLFFSILNDLLLLCLGYSDRQHFYKEYNFHEDKDIHLILQHLTFYKYIDSLFSLAPLMKDYFDLFLTSSYIYNFLKCGEVVPSQPYDVELFHL